MIPQCWRSSLSATAADLEVNENQNPAALLRCPRPESTSVSVAIRNYRILIVRVRPQLDGTAVHPERGVITGAALPVIEQDDLSDCSLEIERTSSFDTSCLGHTREVAQTATGESREAEERFQTCRV